MTGKSKFDYGATPHAKIVMEVARNPGALSLHPRLCIRMQRQLRPDPRRQNKPQL